MIRLIPWPLRSRSMFRLWLDTVAIRLQLSKARRRGRALLCLSRGLDTPERGVLLR